MFNNYSTNNPFSFNNGKTTSNIEDSLMQTYAQLEALKAKQNQISSGTQLGQATVFTDIANEFKDLTEDEISFITNSSEYQSLNNKYQSEFSQFLISKFSNEYLQTTGNTRTLEEMLFTIKSKKDQYKKKFANDINEIRDQNKELAERNNQLAANK
jgi:hypothetical protein